MMINIATDREFSVRFPGLCGIVLPRNLSAVEGPQIQMATFHLKVNGSTHRLETDPGKPLLWALRDELGLKGTKYGCGVGRCGACLVLLDGQPNHACMVPLARVGRRAVTTIEGLDAPGLIEAWLAEQVPQCGYCQPGQLVAAAALLATAPRPLDSDIDAALSGVLCRCGTYQRIRRAIHRAANGSGGNGAPLRPVEALSDLPHDAGIQMNDWIWINGENLVTLMINHSEMGQGALTALVMLFAEELDADLDRVRTVFCPAHDRYRNGLWGEQFTGGSSTIRGEWKRLRELAAKTRLRLVQAAARRWRVPAEECAAREGRVINHRSGRSLSYAELAESAREIPAPRRVPLKKPDEFRVVGRPIARLDLPAMVRGRTRYGIDAEIEGMGVAVVARCPFPGGRVKRHDAQASLALPGVRAVIPISSGVAVVADDFWSAARGRELLEVEWSASRLAALTDADVERQLAAALDRPGTAENERGNARGALRRAKRVAEAVYHTQYVAHATIEPMNCIAQVREGQCDVWVGTQNQAATQETAAELCGLPRSKVRVHTQFLGGGFGRRLETDFVAEAVELSRALGTPVQVVWTRADDLRHDLYRPAHAARVRASLDESGRPVAWLVRIAGPRPALGGVHIPYSIPHIREEHVHADPGVPTGAWRSVGASNNAFVVESFIDELAYAAGVDPIEYRLALLRDEPRVARVLREARRASGWDEPPGAGRGRGVAVYQAFGSVTAQVVEVSVAAREFCVERVVCVIDCGYAAQPDAVRAQLEGGIALGLSAATKEAVRIEHGRAAQSSFEDYPILTLADMPEIVVHILDSDAEPGGAGEPGVPVIAPAVANALFAATGVRLRRLPLRLADGPA